MIIPEAFVKLSVSWPFTIAGNASGEAHNWEGFKTSESMTAYIKLFCLRIYSTFLELFV